MNRRVNPSGKQEKPKNIRYVLKRLWDYLSYFKFLLIISLVLMVLSNAFSLIGPKLSGLAIDAIELGEGKVNFPVVFKYTILMIIFYIFSGIFSYILSIIMLKMSKKIVFKLRKDAFDKITKLPISYFDSNKTGDIISKMNYDIDTINTSLSSDLIQILTSIITVVGSLIMMITISPILVLVFAITIPISLFFTRYMLRKTKKMFSKKSSTLGELNAFSEEMITGLKTIKAYSSEKMVLSRFDNHNEEATRWAYLAEYYSSYTGPGVNFVNNLSLSLICILGAVLSVISNFSLGKISSFILYSRKFSGPINEVANIFTDLQSSLAAAERVFSLIDAAPESSDSYDALELENIKGNVSLKNVYFSYQENGKMILNNVSFEALEGKTVAIVGKTGGGKTTIVNLLMRFYDINKGEILLDNNNIYKIKRNKLREAYAMVLQDTWLFEGSVYENLSYGKKDAILDEVIKAAKACKIHGFIEKLPNGYDTILKDGGVNISKGQKQLLTIARAMLLDANMLILDEATSNVDTQTEVQIQLAMKELMKNKTCFIIAHRLSTIQNADLILVVDEGEIVERGNHQELLFKYGYYYELYNAQFS